METKLNIFQANGNGLIQRLVRALTQNQLTRRQITRIGYFEIWNNSFISINLAYLREIWPPLVLSNWYLGTNFFGKGSDTSFTSQVSPPLSICQLILSQRWNHPLTCTLNLRLFLRLRLNTFTRTRLAPQFFYFICNQKLLKKAISWWT